MINDILIDSTIKYLTSLGGSVNLSFFAFLWNALYYSVSETLKEHELEYDVLKCFLSSVLEIFEIESDREETIKFLFSIHEVVLEELSKANISTDNKDGLLRAHQLVLILASNASSYDGSVIPSASQESSFLLAATSVKRSVAGVFSPPVQYPAQSSPPPSPTTRPAPSANKKKRNIIIAVCAVLVFYLAIIIASLSSNGQGSSPRETQPQLIAKTRPANGAVLLGSAIGESQITVTASSGEDYVVILKTASGVAKLAFYVRAGSTAQLSVPAGNYYVYFASGKQWYGYGQGLMFGRNTSFSKDKNLLDFSKYTWKYTLYPVTNGNFSETPINESEFFK